MLLRRMISHVEDQNWFAVVLDFFIVVGGVLVAFQLTTWGERQAAAERAKVSLFQLYEESEAALGYWIEQVSFEDERLEVQDRVIAALAEGARGDITENEIVAALTGIPRYSALSPPRRAFDELSSAGLLREIDAADAMDAVANYYEQVEFIQGQIGHFRPSAGYSNEVLNYRLMSIYDATRLTRQRIEMDFAALVADAEYLNVLVDEYRNRMIFQFYRRWTMHDAAEMCMSLAEAVGATCETTEIYNEWAELPQWQTRNVPNYGNPEPQDENEEMESEE